MKYWLMKTEPDTFSYDDLIAAPNSTEPWDGIRNYQARNFLRDDFKKGDLVFIYHSRVKDPGIVGVAEVVREGYSDHTALDPLSRYFDPKSYEKGESRWVMVDVKAIRKFRKVLTLAELKTTRGLIDMKVVQKGQRLSIQPVTESEWQIISEIAGCQR
jgi:predicted RNA-binding protein with PUA-like domain